MDPTPEPVLNLRPVGRDSSAALFRDLQITLTGIYVNLAAELVSPSQPISGPVLPKSQLNGLDRLVVGNHSTRAEALSDTFLAMSVTLPLLAGAVDHLLLDSGDGLAGFGKDSLVLLETMAVGALLCNVVKFGVRRPRPYVYDSFSPLAKRQSNGATLSFFSGHTSLAFSMATAYNYLFTVRHPDSWGVLPVWLGTHSVAAATAVMRVQGGKHFWTDVLVGSMVGSAVGLLVPWAHRRESSLFGAEGPLADLRVTPITYHGGGWGVNAMVLW
jgi:membrane-associated phospholipid phosphatase